MIRWLTLFVSGALFGTGLLVSGMTSPAKVVGFLDVTGDWDPSLALVMAGAVGVHFVLHRLVLRERPPLLAGDLHVPSRNDIDVRLLAGAGLFGLGWGLAGYCPGPAVVALAGGASNAWVFVPAMLGGMVAFEAFDWVRSRAEPVGRGTELS